MNVPASNKPDLGDTLLVIHDFKARSSDELSLAKGDRVELLERDDEFGDGWYLGKHLGSGNSGLFPEVYTRLAPKTVAQVSSALPTPKQPHPPLRDVVNDQKPIDLAEAVGSVVASDPEVTPVTRPLNSIRTTTVTSGPQSPYAILSPYSTKNLPALPGSGFATLQRPNTSQDHHVLHETLNVIDEHITDLSTSKSNGGLRIAGDSGSEYSSHTGARLSYIHGEETDEEEGPTHSRAEVQTWNPAQVADYLITVGIDKQHCEVFREQEITGEVLLGMDQASLFIKALELGSVGRRLKTWQKIKNLQDEVNGIPLSVNRENSVYGSDAGSDGPRLRDGTSTVISRSQRIGSLEGRSRSLHSKRHSQAAKPEFAQPLTASPELLADSPTRPRHDKRPSAASVRDLHHSRRHSSTDFRLAETTPDSTSKLKMACSGTLPRRDLFHKKQPSFDRNWTMGNAPYARPLSSTDVQDDLALPDPELQDSAVDLERGYFSGPDAEARRARNVLRKQRDSAQHSNKSSYADEQRIRNGTTLSRHSKLSSVDSGREAAPVSPSPAAQKYFGLGPGRRRTASTATTDSSRLVPGPRDLTFPTVTKLGSESPGQSSPKSPAKRLSQVNHPDFNVNLLFRSGLGGLRAASDAITGNERFKASPIDSQSKESPMYSPSRTTGSSTPSAGPSFELDPNTANKSPSNATPMTGRSNRKKTKKETSAYTRGLEKISPRMAMADADYSGWMKKKSSNLMTTWKPRLFVLKGRRLAYYYSEDDEEEKGLIDISFHRVLPADNERLTGLHATLTGAMNTPTIPAGSSLTTLAATQAKRDTTVESDSVFIFKLVPPRAGLSRAVNFTKPTVHYFAVPNIKQGRLWMAALMKATIDRDDTQPITTTYQQKTISLTKARQLRHRPPALMGLEEGTEGLPKSNQDPQKKERDGLGIVYSEADSGISGIEKLCLSPVDSARARDVLMPEKTHVLPQSA